jgi:serine protease Do
MRSNAAKPVIPLSLTLIVCIVIALVIRGTCSFADPVHPERGSIVFGASQKPDIPSSSQLGAFKTVIADVAEKVVPTVVSVIPTKIDTVVFSNNPFYQFFGDDPFGDFFGQPQRGRQRQNRPPVEKRELRQQALGSGVIVSKDGYILTNYHVVAGANEIEVKTADKRNFRADVVGLDSLADVAVIKIKETVNDLPVAYLGNSDKLRPGDWAIAVGNPFNFTSSVTLGIVSALKRTAPGGSDAYQNFIQTDAAINPGNSGGALVNIDGELIGINTMIYTQSGGYMGIGFAIPINMARQIMEDLIYEGKVSRGWLGVSIQELDGATREAMGLDAGVKGALIGDVFKGQPADKAGIKRGDVVTAVDGHPVDGPNELRLAVAAIHPGEKVPVALLRGNKAVTVQVTLTNRNTGKMESAETGHAHDEGESADPIEKLGMKTQGLTADKCNELGIDPDTKGVVVLDVTSSSQAYEQGLRQNDIILEVNRRPIASQNDFKDAVKSVKAGESLLFLLLRDGNTFFTAFKREK